MSLKQIANEYEEAIALATTRWHQAVRAAQDRMEMRMLGVDPDQPKASAAKVDTTEIAGLPVLPRGLGPPG